MLYYVQIQADKETYDLFFDASDELDAAARAYHLYPHGKIIGVRLVNTVRDSIHNVRFVDFINKAAKLRKAR